MTIGKIQIGVAAESVTDADVVAGLCRNILRDVDLRLQLLRENIYSNDTKIKPSDIKKITDFFASKCKNRPRLIIISTDQDNNKKTRLGLETVIAEQPILQEVVFAIPAEELEAWLIQKTSAINYVLKPENKFQKIRKDHYPDAKNILSDLIGLAIKSDNFVGTEQEAKIKIAQYSLGCEIDTQDYLTFKKEFLNAAKKALSVNIFEKKKLVKVKKITRTKTKTTKQKEPIAKPETVEQFKNKWKLPWWVRRKIARKRRRRKKGGEGEKWIKYVKFAKKQQMMSNLDLQEWKKESLNLHLHKNNLSLPIC